MHRVVNVRTPLINSAVANCGSLLRLLQIIHLFICSTPPSSQQKAIIKGGKKIGKEWERIEELEETFLQCYIYVRVWEKY